MMKAAAGDGRAGQRREHVGAALALDASPRFERADGLAAERVRVADALLQPGDVDSLGFGEFAGIR
jgi:hypothetical protein